MGLLIDTDVLTLAERGKATLDLGRFQEEGMAYISTITASELLVAGIHSTNVSWKNSPGCWPRQ